MMVLEAFEPDEADVLGDDAPALRLGNAAHAQAELDVFLGRQPVEKRRVALEHDRPIHPRAL